MSGKGIAYIQAFSHQSRGETRNQFQAFLPKYLGQPTKHSLVIADTYDDVKRWCEANGYECSDAPNPKA